MKLSKEEKSAQDLIKNNIFKMVRSGDIDGLNDILQSTDRNLLKINSSDRDGNSALMLAIQGGHTEIASLLIENGANPNLKNLVSGKDTEDMSLDAMGEGKGNESFIFIQNDAARLHRANLKSRINPLDRALIDSNYKDIETYQQEFNDQLLTAISNIDITDKNIDLRKIRQLLKNGANPNVTFPETKSADYGANNSLLHKAALCDDPKLARLLLAHGADVMAENSLHKRPYDLALEGHKKLNIETLLSAQEKLRKKVYDPQLINAIADLDPNSAHLDLEKVKQALSNGANPNAVHAETGNTAIHGACYFKDPSLAKLLLAEGASISHKNKNGETVIEIAMAQQNTAVIMALTNHDPLTRLTTTATYKVEPVRNGQKTPDRSDRHSPKSITQTHDL